MYIFQKVVLRRYSGQSLYCNVSKIKYLKSNAVCVVLQT